MSTSSDLLVEDEALQQFFAKSSANDSPDRPDYSADPINILLVDDEPKNLVVLETILQDPGYRLVRAASAEEGLLSLVSEEFAVIVLDIHMPGMSGFEMAQMVKQRKKTANIPIIFLTAYYHEDQHVLEGYGTGAVDYLHKPVNPAILRSKVSVFADLHRKTRQIAHANQKLMEVIAERQRVQHELLELNAQLEQRVEQRAADLLQANTALRQFARELSESDRRKDEFLAILAHELRNPLAPIRNGLHLLRLNVQDPNVVNSALDVMERQVGQIVRLVDDLLDVSRISRGKIELRKERIELAPSIKDAIESVRSLADSKNHELVISLLPRPVFLEADPIRLTQLIGNLLNNACKFTPAGGRITISVEAEREQCILHVADNGIGIAAEQLSRIFEMFTQVDTSLERSQNGLGIGLTLVKSLVEMHGGSVQARSAGLGEGSEFILRFPTVKEAPDSRQNTGCELSPQPGTRVLVVDDNRDSADSLVCLLNSSGLTCQAAYDGQQALEVVAKFLPDIVLLDIGLPKLNGYDVARSIRARSNGKEVILVALTGWGQEKDRSRSTEAGFNRHLVKPVEYSDLKRLLAELTA